MRNGGVSLTINQIRTSMKRLSFKIILIFHSFENLEGLVFQASCDDFLVGFFEILKICVHEIVRIFKIIIEIINTNIIISLDHHFSH